MCLHQSFKSEEPGCIQGSSQWQASRLSAPCKAEVGLVFPDPFLPKPLAEGSRTKMLPLPGRGTAHRSRTLTASPLPADGSGH